MQPPDNELGTDDIDAREVIAVFDGDDIEVLEDDIEVLDNDSKDDIEALEDAPADALVVPRPPVDPRIRARRIAVAREQGRRRLRVVLVLLSIFVAVGFAWLIVQSPFFDVDHIVVTGVPEARVAAVVAATGVHRHDALLMVSAGKVARRIEAVPGIGTVRVSRDFPGTLRISVNEQGVALWARVPAGGVALVGHDGRVLRYAPTNPAGIVELRGQKLVPAPGGQLIRAEVVDVLAQLPAALAERVGALREFTTRDVRLYLVVGGEVRLGDLSSVHDKAVAAEAVIERMACPLVYVDVRSLSNPVALPAPGARCSA
jgi:cell division protein FtsQ